MRLISTVTTFLFILMILAPNLLCPVCSLFKCEARAACEVKTEVVEHKVVKQEEVKSGCPGRSCCSQKCPQEPELEEVEYLTEFGSNCSAICDKPCDLDPSCCCAQIPKSSEFTVEKRSTDKPNSDIPSGRLIDVADKGSDRYFASDTKQINIHPHIPTTVLRL